MGKIFKNKYNELRSGWKIIIVVLSYQLMQLIILIIGGGIISIVVVNSRNRNFTPEQINMEVMSILNSGAGRFVSQIIGLLCLILVLYIILKTIDRKRFRDIGFTFISRDTGTDLIYGLFMGAVSMTVIFIILLITNNIKLDRGLLYPVFSMSTLFGLISFVIVGISEELLSRGYCINALNVMGKPWMSVIISSVIFSLLHLLNPNLRVFGLLNIALVGILFGYMYLKTNNLWMPIGYHITWNYFQGDIFGLPVSGLNQKGVYNISTYTDNLLTGGNFGPEAGILATIIIIMGILLIWGMPSYKNRPDSFGMHSGF